MRVLAIVCVRNEELHIRNLLDGLVRDGLDVVLIDHGSTDWTLRIAREFMGKGLLEIRSLPWTGVFSLREQLEAKWMVVKNARHDWIVHVDADEWLLAPREGQRLIDAIEYVDRAGYNCINFNEFVFVPNPREDFTRVSYRNRINRYYYFQPAYPYLQRAWKASEGLDNRGRGGHLIEGNVRMYPESFIMHHYIALSETQAQSKYVGRPFAAAEVNDGWHDDRVVTTAENLRFPRASDPRFHVHDGRNRELLDVTKPVTKHYWEWNE